MDTYVPLPRRRRSGVTDYRARKKAIMSRGVLLAIRISGKNVSAQFIKPTIDGDRILSSAHSRVLRKKGWKGSLKSTPACYLLGLFAGKKAAEKGVNEAYLYNGPTQFVRGSRVSAFVKGVADSGVKVPISDDVFPGPERLKGQFIGEYASALLKEDKEEYTRRFGALLKAGFRPEDYPANYERVRQAILGGQR